jgi:hypothetical protein
VAVFGAFGAAEVGSVDPDDCSESDWVVTTADDSDWTTGGRDGSDWMADPGLVWPLYTFFANNCY